MAFTTAEKLTLTMLCDLARPPGDRELDYEFIAGAVHEGDLWALDWRYPGLELRVKTPEEVRVVCDILDMWSNLERSFNQLNEREKRRVAEDPRVLGEPKFLGFSGNDETEYLHIGRRLVRDLGRWEEFAKRDMNSHFPSLEMHLRLFTKYKPIWDAKIEGGGPYELNADQIIQVMSEQIHPENREPQPDGSWKARPTNYKG